MLKIKTKKYVIKKNKAFTLIEALIVIMLVSIFLTSILFTQKNIISNSKKLSIEARLLENAKNYIYECQAKNQILSTNGDISVNLINSKNNVESYKYKAEKDGSKIEIIFSISRQ